MPTTSRRGIFEMSSFEATKQGDIQGKRYSDYFELGKLFWNIREDTESQLYWAVLRWASFNIPRIAELLSYLIISFDYSLYLQ